MAMDSWWQLGEGMGFQGDKLEVWRITCPFCNESGNFALAYHGEKKKTNSDKRLNFDVYRARTASVSFMSFGRQASSEVLDADCTASGFCQGRFVPEQSCPMNLYLADSRSLDQTR